MGRIWDAVKQAEQERAHSTGQKPAAHSKSDSGDNRRSKRSKHQVPLLVYGSNSAKQAFHEDAQTVEINEDGCSILLESTVMRGQRLFLVNTRNQAEQECRVVHQGKRTRGKAQIGVEFLRPAPEFWYDS